MPPKLRLTSSQAFQVAFQVEFPADRLAGYSAASSAALPAESASPLLRRLLLLLPQAGRFRWVD